MGMGINSVAGCLYLDTDGEEILGGASNGGGVTLSVLFGVGEILVGEARRFVRCWGEDT